MRRENRRKNVKNKRLTDKIILYSEAGVVILLLIVFALFMYSKSLNKDIKNNNINLEKIANLENTTQNTQSASTEIGKSIEESENELNKNTNDVANKTNTINTINTTNTATISDNSNNYSLINQTITSKGNDLKKKEETVSKEQSTPEEKKGGQELKFEKPVEGEIVKEYAKDNLIYSETLKEWTTHLGIDIKAEKTTVVKAAETGTIKSIKNDPRFGLTIVIEHENGFQTMYSNLLTSEFVVENEKVEKGQAIGTVGNTGMFEIADEPHLHFEILKNGIQEDPNIYIK